MTDSDDDDRSLKQIPLDYTDSEWMSIIDKERDGLPYCCGNISALRDSLISAARNGGIIEMFEVERVRLQLGAVIDGHDVAEMPLMQRLVLLLTDQNRPPIHVPNDFSEFLK